MIRYAVAAIVVLACRGEEDSMTADARTSSADSGRTLVQDTAAKPAAAASPVGQGNPSLDPGDTVPVRRAPPSTQSIVDTATLPTIQKIVAHHPQEVDSTLMSITEELNRANRAPSAQWTALQDSVKADLQKLASLRDGELVTFFRQHYARFNRLTRMQP
jgi:hypothetical protein